MPAHFDVREFFIQLLDTVALCLSSLYNMKRQKGTRFNKILYMNNQVPLIKYFLYSLKGYNCVSNEKKKSTVEN